MIVRVDSSMADLGIREVVLAAAWNIDPRAAIVPDVQRHLDTIEKTALDGGYADLPGSRISEGYRDLLKKAGRSVKKNPPTVPDFLESVIRRGHLPHINTVVDIYNAETLASQLAIGGHDYDKIQSPLVFTVSGKEDEFHPIGGSTKHVASTDFVYRDKQGIIAWIGVKDSDAYKMSDYTRNALFVIQGNSVTTVEERVSALQTILLNLHACMPQSGGSIYICKASEEVEIDPLVKGIWNI